MTGSAEGPSSESVRFEPDGHGGWTVMLDGQPQSHVDLADPGLITFEYVQHFALAIGACSPTAPAPLRVTHVGGAGLTLARWVQHTRPVSPQIVLEPDAALTAAVRERLPLPRGHRIRVRPLDGRTGVRGLATASADVLVLDAYAAGRVPAELATPEFLADVARVLAPGGLLLANLADEPGLRWAARFLATLASVEGFGGPAVLAVLATHDVLKGRRFGNLVAVASRGADDLANPAPTDAGPARSDSARLSPTDAEANRSGSARLSPTDAEANRPDSSGLSRTGDGQPRLDLAALRRAGASAPIPTGIRSGPEVTRLIAGARPFTDADAQPSPVPPDPGAWRVR